jgi:hypothetical protein
VKRPRTAKTANDAEAAEVDDASDHVGVPPCGAGTVRADLQLREERRCR